ncbi:response regulator [Confluentibacter sediminis]|uniref:PD-(D/E)XK nuclease domain-containing protein n=1 Tax=Confluentibacter sediminis TaxID=2219045 RepID=UPI000DAE22C2|nr:response regulator [Confluentibacter sediminis]
MIQILIVDDNPSKQNKIKNTILDNHDILGIDITIADCVKEARKHLYSNECDLMILDLVLPIEKNSNCDALNSIRFLNEISISPSIIPPIHIVGLSGYKEQVLEHNDDFKKKLWNLIDYEEDTTSWQDQLNSIIFHLVKTRQKFLGTSIENKLNVYFSELESKNLPITFLGAEWLTIGNNLMNIVEKSLFVPSKFSNGAKAKNINIDSLKISSEYDFQNLIHLILRPWLPNTEPENVAITYDGNKKNADFSVNGSSIIIEVKYIDSTGKKNDTLKTLEGLKEFYKMNANVKLLLFMILVEDSISIDNFKIESDFSSQFAETTVVAKVFKNNLKS